jgi:hypothetical protein
MAMTCETSSTPSTWTSTFACGKKTSPSTQRPPKNLGATWPATTEPLKHPAHRWDWQIWWCTASKAARWCARRWDDERRVLNADSPEELVQCLEAQASE